MSNTKNHANSYARRINSYLKYVIIEAKNLCARESAVKLLFGIIMAIKNHLYALSHTHIHTGAKTADPRSSKAHKSKRIYEKSKFSRR